MKSLHLIIYFFVGAMIFCACAETEVENLTHNAQDAVETVNDDYKPSLFQSEPSSSGEVIKAKINAFRTRLQATIDGDLSFRSEDLTVEEAKWNIEATLNATFARADAPFSELDKAESEFTVPVTDGKVNNEDALTAYQTALGRLTDHYDAVQFDEREPLVIDIEVNELSSDEATFQVTTFVTAAPPPPPPPSSCNVFGATDFWYWGYAAGRCCEGGGEGIDAADVLAQEINFRRPLPNNHLYFTDIEGLNLDPVAAQPFYMENAYDDNPNDGRRDFLVFLATQEELDSGADCIPPDDMDWYYCNILDIAAQYTPSGKTFSHLTLEDELIFWGDDPRFHYGIMYYGTSVMCDCPPYVPVGPLSVIATCC